jgi:gamma-glutamyltranspeptidase/glutathione hydrolase
MKETTTMIVILTLILVISPVGTTPSTAAGNAPITFEDTVAQNGMVAAANKLASEAGVAILKKGGNAVDAAVATALALSVVEPNACSLAGGGFTTIRLKDGSFYCWDFREMAPASATKDMFASEQAKKERWSARGGKSVAVPGAVVGLFTALEKYGTMSFSEVAAPAVELAEQGFPVDPLLASMINDNLEKINAYNPEGTVYTPDKLPLEEGVLLKQPKLAAAFRLLAEKGLSEFYSGAMGQAFVDAVNKAGGKMTMTDLANYKIHERTPMTGTYRGFKIVAPPPASSGGTHVIEILNVMENFPVKEWGHNSERYLHHLAETSKMMFADRARYMADPAFTEVPLEGLSSKEYAKKLAESIGPDAKQEVPFGDPLPYANKKQASFVPADEPEEHLSTTHFSVLDKDGNMVAWTWTINNFFGSGVYVPEYGIIVNDQMVDFSPDPKSVNAPEPGKRPLSSMTPSLVLTPEGKPFMTLGSPGATRIILAVAQIIMNAVDFGMSMDEAIEAPRIFNLVTGGKADQLMIEAGIADSTLDALRLRRHNVNPRAKDLFFGGAQGIMLKDGKIIGGADSRRNGVVVGY